MLLRVGRWGVGGRRAAGTDGSFQSLPQLFSLPFIPASELFQHLAQILLKELVSYWLEPGSSLSAGQSETERQAQG